jgi:hypothetical protein
MIHTCKRLIARMARIVSFSVVSMYLGHVPPEIMQPTKQLVACFAVVPSFTVTIKWMHLCVMLHLIRPVIKWHVAQFAFSPPNTFFCYFVFEPPWTVLILIRTAHVVHLQTMLVCYTFCTVKNISGRFKAFRITALQGISLKQIWIQNDFLYSLAGSWKKRLILQQLMYGISSLCAPTVRKCPHSIFDVLLTVHLSIFILVINQLDAQNLVYNKFISCLYMFRAPCAWNMENFFVNITKSMG